MTNPRPGTRRYEGRTIAACPVCQEAGRGREKTEPYGTLVTVDTNDASRVEEYQAELGTGLRFIDVPCHECGAFYTIEMAPGPPYDGPPVASPEDLMRILLGDDEG